jgi:co-chaperonin GroES (HSP10)
MRLEARNKRLVLEKLSADSNEESSGFIMPANMKKSRPLNEMYRVVDLSNDCSVSVGVGDIVLVEGNMVEETHIADDTFLTCKENFVIGVLQE